MAQATPELKQVIRCFCQELQKMGIHADRVLLFGSHATGMAHEGSDVDLIIVSPDWVRYSELQRLATLVSLPGASWNQLR